MIVAAFGSQEPCAFGRRSPLNPAGPYILLLFVGANLLNYMDRYVLAAVLNPLGQSLQLDDGQLGRLAFVFLIVYLLAAPLFSYLAERYPRTRLVAIGIFIWSFATAAAALAQDYSTLLLTRALVGVGEAAYGTLGPSILADLYPEKSRARVFTWFYLAIPVGSALGYALGGVVEGWAGWRMSFLVAGAPGLLLTYFFWKMREPQLGAQDDYSIADENRSYGAKIKSLFYNRIWVACTLSYVGYTFAMGALSHWAPTLFQRLHGQSASTAGMTFGAIAVLTGIVGTLMGGHLTDRLQGRYPNIGIWISVATLLAAAPVMTFGLLTRDLSTAYVLWSLAMFLLFINTSPVNTMTISCLPAPLRATGMAMNIFLIHALGDAISPEWVGRLSMAGGSHGEALAQALLVSVPALVFAGVVLLFALQKRKVNSQ